MLPEQYRIKGSKTFTRLFKEGKRLDLPYAQVIFMSGQGRIAIGTSRQIGSIVKRNRTKRRWREALGTLLEFVPENLDTFIIVKPSGADFKGQSVIEAIRVILSQLRP